MSQAIGVGNTACHSQGSDREIAVMATRMLIYAIEEIRPLGNTDCNSLLHLAVKELRRAYRIKSEELFPSKD